MSRAAQAMVTEILNKMSSSDPLEIRETVQGVAPLDQDVVGACWLVASRAPFLFTPQ